MAYRHDFVPEQTSIARRALRFPLMGDMVTFKSNGHTCDGYLAGSGPGVLVIQEWWGLVPHIKDVVDRFAAAGFTASGTVDEVRAIVLPKLCALFDDSAAPSSALTADVRGASR